MITIKGLSKSFGKKPVVENVVPEVPTQVEPVVVQTNTENVVPVVDGNVKKAEEIVEEIKAEEDEASSEK